MLVGMRSGVYNNNQLSPGMSCFGKLAPLQLSKQISPCVLHESLGRPFTFGTGIFPNRMWTGSLSLGMQARCPSHLSCLNRIALATDGRRQLCLTFVLWLCQAKPQINLRQFTWTLQGAGCVFPVPSSTAIENNDNTIIIVWKMHLSKVSVRCLLHQSFLVSSDANLHWLVNDCFWRSNIRSKYAAYAFGHGHQDCHCAILCPEWLPKCQSSSQWPKFWFSQCSHPPPVRNITKIICCSGWSWGWWGGGPLQQSVWREDESFQRLPKPGEGSQAAADECPGPSYVWIWPVHLWQPVSHLSSDCCLYWLLSCW